MKLDTIPPEQYEPLLRSVRYQWSAIFEVLYTNCHTFLKLHTAFILNSLSHLLTSNPRQILPTQLCTQIWLPFRLAYSLFELALVNQYAHTQLFRQQLPRQPQQTQFWQLLIQMLFAKSLHVDHVALRKLSARILNRKLIRHTVLQIKSL